MLTRVTTIRYPERMDDMEFLTNLAKEIGEDGGEPTGGDVATVVQYFNFPQDPRVETIIRSALVEAGYDYRAAEAMQDDPRHAVAKYTDDRPSDAAAEYWQQEFTQRGEAELEGMLGKIRAVI